MAQIIKMEESMYYKELILKRNPVLYRQGLFDMVKTEAKLMYGMLFSIKSFVTKISPLDVNKGFLCYKTSKYALHCFETPTGLKFVVNTDVGAQNIRDFLKQVYIQVYVEYIVKNPVVSLQDLITSELFKQKLDIFVKQSPAFSSNKHSQY